MLWKSLHFGNGLLEKLARIFGATGQRLQFSRFEQSNRVVPVEGMDGSVGGVESLLQQTQSLATLAEKELSLLVPRKDERLSFQHGEGRRRLTTSHQGSGENRECRDVPEFPRERLLPWLNVQLRIDRQ